jgi:hypothetical protein
MKFGCGSGGSKTNWDVFEIDVVGNDGFGLGNVMVHKLEEWSY